MMAYFSFRQHKIDKLAKMKTFENSVQLIFLLVSRDLNLRYRKSLGGILWTLMNPVITSFVLWTVFNQLFKGNFSNNLDYVPYLVIGVLFLSFWNQGILMSAESIAGNSQILTKIKVNPRLFALANSISSYLNFLLGIIPLIALCLILNISLRPWFPLVLIFGFIFVFFISGVGLTLSLLFIRFDDSRNIINVLLLTLGYLTPVFYPLEILNRNLQNLVSLSPLTVFLELTRWSIIDNYKVEPWQAVLLILYSLTFFVLGNYFFTKFWPKIVSML